MNNCGLSHIVRIEIDDSTISEVAAAGLDPAFGARPLKRAIQSPLETRWPRRFPKVASQREMQFARLTRAGDALRKGVSVCGVGAGRSMEPAPIVAVMKRRMGTGLHGNAWEDNRIC